jgi:hypothetical protein
MICMILSRLIEADMEESMQSIASKRIMYNAEGMKRNREREKSTRKLDQTRKERTHSRQLSGYSHFYLAGASSIAVSIILCFVKDN